MRILAIRGRNLASLEAEFELDLVNGALGGAGVFAIVGSTGAGKSTLLDALCVALFDRTPRLGNHSRVQVSRGPDDPTALGAHDVRTLLRRGASSGWAEVDFEAGDGRRYRARWAVRRARDHSDGTMQDASITLTDLDRDQRLGGTKTETLKAIHARLGLSFDQFRRSALLAQGEFAMFLRADGKDRSELLERMTGTEIYSRLSIAAHERAAAADLRVRLGRAAVEAIAVFSADARGAVERELAAAIAATSVARSALVAAEQAARWLAVDARHASAVAEAERAVAIAAAAVAGASETRAELASRRRAEAVRGAWDDAARADRDLTLAVAELAAATVAEHATEIAHAELQARRSRIAAIHAPLSAARLAIGAHPATSIAALPSACSDAAVAAATASASWLVSHAALAPHIAGFTELDARFAQHSSLAAAIDALTIAIHRRELEHATHSVDRTTARAQERAAAAKLGEAERVVIDIHRKRRLSLDDAHQAAEAAHHRCTEVERLVRITAGARADAGARAGITSRRAELAGHGARDQDARVAAAAAHDRAVALRTERTRALVELRRAAGYQHARAELSDGEPCPLCGGLEHPWRDRGAFDDLIEAAEIGVDAISAELDVQLRELATIDARTSVRGRDRTALDARDDELASAMTTAALAWRTALAALGELALVDDPTTAAAEAVASARLAAADDELRAARDARSQASAVAKAITEAQALARAHQVELDGCVLRLREIDGALAAFETEVAQLRGERSSAVVQHAELGNRLAASVAQWRSALPVAAHVSSDPVAGRSVLAELATRWQLEVATLLPIEAAVAATGNALDAELRVADRAVAAHTTRRADCALRRDQRATERSEAVAALEAARIAADLNAAELATLLAASPSRVDELTTELAALDRGLDLGRALIVERDRLAADHRASRPPALDTADQVDALNAAVALADQHAAKLAASLTADTEASDRRAVAEAELAAADAAAQVDRVLGAAIGSHDGKLFRSFAQSLTLDSLLAVANAHLEELAPRYQLQRVPRHDLELQVVDRDLGAEVRSVQSLSGGESFLVSLALALGLSSMSANDVRVRTLLIDEGFGTLDPSTLDGALAVLDALQATGRQVGVISHVPALIERVGAHVRVIPRGGGRSDVIVGA